MDANRAEIIASFVTLKRLTDERGHELLEAMRDLCLAQCDVSDTAGELAEAAVFRCDIDESAGLAARFAPVSHLSDLDGYSLGDPKRGMLENGNGRPW